MRTLSRLLAALLVLPVALAGCLGDKEAPSDPAANATATGAAGATMENVTVDDGTTEMSADVGHMPHVHDYWKDRERITIMDDDVNVDAPDALFWTFVDVMRGTPGVGGAQIRMPDGQIVFEGTGKLEFTASWTDATVTGMAVAYRTPADSQWTKPVEVKSATPISVDVTPEMTDMPHAKSSRWQFLVQPGAAGQAIVGKFHVKVDIVRMRDVSLFPGHPELFNGEHTLEVLNGHGTSKQGTFADAFVAFATRQGQQDDGVASQKVVPMETRSMTANLTLKSATGTTGSPTVYLGVKPADRNGYIFVEAVATDEGKQLFQYAWMVQMQQTDSPYASESDWKFDVFVVSEGTGGTPLCQAGCNPVTADYDIVVVAYDDVVPDAKELRSGGRG